MGKIIWFTIFISFLGLTVYYFYPEEKLLPHTQIDNIVVYKSARKMLAYSNSKLVKTYKISLGRQPVGAKQFEGDKKTPEGVYFINAKNPNSVCHKNLGISYPNAVDIANAGTHKRSTGGDIKIHGLMNGYGYVGKFHRWFDWTFGCIAVTDEEMNELYNSVKVGARIEIYR